MNYETKKEEEKKKRRRKAAIVFAVIGVLIVALCAVNFFMPVDTWKYRVNLPKTSARQEGELRVHYLNVGQGDATIIELPDGRNILVDGGSGEAETTTEILRYLNALKIEKLYAIVLTHVQSAGALSEILEIKGAEYAYMPKIYNYSVDSDYAALCTSLNKSATKEIYIELGERIYSDGDTPYSITFLSPSKTSNPSCEYEEINDGEFGEEELNDASAVFLLEYAGVRVLFTGRASERIEKKLMRSDKLGVWRQGVMKDVYLKADVLKVADYGDNASSCAEFLEYIEAKNAVISYAADNAYGYPHEGTIERLEAIGAKIYKTATDGTILLTVSENGEYKLTT